MQNIDNNMSPSHASRDIMSFRLNSEIGDMKVKS